MARYRQSLPQLGTDLFLADGGIETTLIFLQGQDLPYFASFHLLRTEEGTEQLRKYFRDYAELARRVGVGLVLESATWRSNPDWATQLGYSAEQLAAANRAAIEMLAEIRDQYETAATPIVISGCLGPRGDGYIADQAMSADEAADYHAAQIGVFAGADADMVSAITMNYVEEAEGIARASRKVSMPVAISFTVETDGRLPTGQPLAEAIDQVDATSNAYPAYYMINCAHPSHFAGIVESGGPAIGRIRGLRANASRMSHAELNEAPELDIGNPAELGREYADLKRRLPQLAVLGGCCGTDTRHIEEIAGACLPLFRG